MSPPDALREALGQVIATLRRDWRRELECVQAESRAVIAELRAENTTLRVRLEEAAAAAMARVRDGRDGVDGRDGAPGRDADPVTDERIAAVVAAHLAMHPPAAGRDGRDGADGKDGAAGRDADPVTDERLAAVVSAYLSAHPAAPGRDGRDGVDGKDGAPGAPGEQGRLPAARAWEDRVHYALDVVTHDGCLYQAQRDTGRAPPHDDWLCLAARGRDGEAGRSLNICGTYREGEAYQHLDVVALNGASFVARRDAPGACPGDGWQLVAAQGKSGRPGEPGRPGMRGERGDAGPGVAALDVDDDGMVTLTHADGSTVTLDLYPLLSRLTSVRRAGGA